MGQVINKVLPTDAAGQKLLAPYDPTEADFFILQPIGMQTKSPYDVAFLGVGGAYKSTTTHNAAAVDTEGVSQGEDGSTTSAVDARGFTHATFFMTVAGLEAGETVGVRLHPRSTNTGDDFSPALSVITDLSNGSVVIEDITLSWPFFMVEAYTTKGTATVTVKVYEQYKGG